jgi:hypothetical protein
MFELEEDLQGEFSIERFAGPDLLLSGAAGNAVSVAQASRAVLRKMHWPIAVKGPPNG